MVVPASVRAIMTRGEKRPCTYILHNFSSLRPFTPVWGRASRRRGKPETRGRGKFRGATRGPVVPLPTSGAPLLRVPACVPRDGVGRPGVCGTGNLEELGDMAVTARNAWNVARHAAPAQSHGAIHRPFGPLPIRFRCPSSFCHEATGANSESGCAQAEIAPKTYLLLFPSPLFFSQICMTFARRLIHGSLSSWHASTPSLERSLLAGRKPRVRDSHTEDVRGLRDGLPR